MPVRTQFGPGLKVLATGTATVASTGGANVDFDAGGSVNDINLPTLAGFKSTDRLLVAVFAYKSTGTTSKLVVTVQDADDVAGVFGTPATAQADAVPNLPLTGASTAVGPTVAMASLAVKPDRPWIRVKGATDTGTDSFAVTAYLLALPALV